MRLILLSILFVYAQCRPEMPPGNVEGIKDYWNKAMERALKRKFGEGYTPSPDDECTKACQKPPPSDFAQYTLKFTQPGPESMKAFYNKEFLSKVCAFANETANCVRACPDTQRRQYLKSLFAPVKYLCADSHLVDNADCLGAVTLEEGPRCLTGQCAAQKSALDQAVQSYMTAQPKTKEISESTLAKFCEFMDCTALCGQAARQSKCGNTTEAEVRQFYNVLGQSLSEARYLSPQDYVVDIPPVCVHAI